MTLPAPRPVASTAWPAPNPDERPRRRPVRGVADVRRSEPGARRSGPAQLGRRPAVRPARGDRREHRAQRRSGGTARLRRPRPDRGAPRQRRDGLDDRLPRPELLTPGQWAHETLEAYRPLFTDLATSLGAPAKPDTADERPDGADDGRHQPDAGAGDARHGGRLDGRQARPARVRVCTTCRSRASQHEIVLVGGTIDAFAAAWEIPIDEMRLWVLAHELCGHALFSVPHIREPLADLVRRHVGGVPARPRGGRRQARQRRVVRRRPVPSAAAGVRRSGGAARRSALARPAGARAARSTLPSQRWSATPTGSSMRSRCG